MNSVGHLVASEARRRAVRATAERPAAPQALRRIVQVQAAEAELARLQETSVTTLEHALRLAMHTIRNASERIDGDCGWSKATRLLRAEPHVACPFPEVRNDRLLQGLSVERYIGWYHTDVTLPSEYFQPDAGRPMANATPYELDLTYLHAGRGREFRHLAVGVPSGRTAKAKGTRRKK